MEQGHALSEKLQALSLRQVRLTSDWRPSRPALRALHLAARRSCRVEARQGPGTGVAKDTRCAEDEGGRGVEPQRRRERRMGLHLRPGTIGRCEKGNAVKAEISHQGRELRR